MSDHSKLLFLSKGGKPQPNNGGSHIIAIVQESVLASLIWGTTSCVSSDVMHHKYTPSNPDCFICIHHILIYNLQ